MDEELHLPGFYLSISYILKFSLLKTKIILVSGCHLPQAVDFLMYPVLGVQGLLLQEAEF